MKRSMILSSIASIFLSCSLLADSTEPDFNPCKFNAEYFTRLGFEKDGVKAIAHCNEPLGKNHVPSELCVFIAIKKEKGVDLSSLHLIGHEYRNEFNENLVNVNDASDGFRLVKSEDTKVIFYDGAVQAEAQYPLHDNNFPNLSTYYKKKNIYLDYVSGGLNYDEYRRDTQTQTWKTTDYWNFQCKILK